MERLSPHEALQVINQLISAAIRCGEAANRLEELNKERAEMVEALRKAEAMHVRPPVFSKWTAEDPTTEPDFVD
jgi:hypothetical protein